MTSPELKSQLTSTAKFTKCLDQMNENGTKGDLIDSATPSANVSAFCRAVLSKLIPDGFWGHGPDGVENKGVVMLNVDHFVRMRRFETLNLHEIYQGIKVIACPWLTFSDLKSIRSKVYHGLYRLLFNLVRMCQTQICKSEKSCSSSFFITFLIHY